jgi:hypothetical protein
MDKNARPELYRRIERDAEVQLASTANCTSCGMQVKEIWDDYDDDDPDAVDPARMRYAPASKYVDVAYARARVTSISIFWIHHANGRAFASMVGMVIWIWL